jgi:hypothetical protein
MRKREVEAIGEECAYRCAGAVRPRANESNAQ